MVYYGFTYKLKQLVLGCKMESDIMYLSTLDWMGVGCAPSQPLGHLLIVTRNGCLLTRLVVIEAAVAINRFFLGLEL